MDQPPQPRPPLRERKREQLRASLHDAAVRLFNERGFANVSIEEIAEEAGVSPRTFFRYFPVKEDAVFAQNSVMLGRLEAELAIADRALPVMDRVRHAFTFTLRDLFEHSSHELAPLLAREPVLAARLESHNLVHEEVVARYLAEEAGGDPLRQFRARLMAAAVLGALTRARREMIHATSAVSFDLTHEALALVSALQVAWDELMAAPAYDGSASPGMPMTDMSS